MTSENKNEEKTSCEGSREKDLKHFGVIIYYKEPLFCKTIGKDPHTVFSALYHVKAESADEAREKASDEFKTLAKLSSVHWERLIVKSEVKLLKV